MSLTETPQLSPIQGLAVELQRQLETKRDLVASTPRISFEGGHLNVDLADGVEQFEVNRHAHGQIATDLDVPWKLYERLLTKHPELHNGLVNGLFAREPSKHLIRVMDGTARAFLSDKYRPRDNWDLMEHLMPVVAEYPDVQFNHCDLTDTRLYVKLTVPGMEVQVTPKVGDVIRGGVIISNSEVGSGSLYIYPWSLKLDCLNGMTHTEYGKRRIHVGSRIKSEEEAYEFFSDATMKLDDQAFFAKCADVLRGCLTQQVFEAIAAQMRDLAAITIPGSPVDVVQEITKQHNFNEEEGKSILQHLITGADLSAWGYVNAITATARDLDDADRQTEIETLAGKLTSVPTWATAFATA